MFWMFRKCSSLGLSVKCFTPTLFTAAPAGHLLLNGSVADARMELFSVSWLGSCVSRLQSRCLELTGLSDDSGSYLQSGLHVPSTLSRG